MGAFARALACLSLVVAAAGHAQVADTVPINGKVITADERGAIHQAVAIGDGRIVAMGSSVALRKLADLVVLDRDFMTVPVAEIAGLHSLLTMIGRRMVYAEAPYQRYEK